MMIKNIRKNNEKMNSKEIAKKWDTLVNIFLTTNSCGLLIMVYVTIMSLAKDIKYISITILPLLVFSYFEYRLIKTKKSKDIKKLGFCLKITMSIIGSLY